jgi:PAS domain-containing protein
MALCLRVCCCFNFNMNRMHEEIAQRRGAVPPTTTRRPPSKLDRRLELLGGSEEQLREFMDAIPQIMWTNNADGTANYFNRRWYEYTGHTPDQPAGRQPFIQRTPRWQATAGGEQSEPANRSSANTGCATRPGSIGGS